MPESELFFLADIIGIIFFAMSGAYVAIRKRLDLLGFFISGFLTALGGGVIRDILLNRSPVAFHALYPALTVFITLLVFIFFRLQHRIDLEKKGFFVFSDTVGLVAFSIAGALLGLEAELNLFGIIVLSFMTAVGGGVLRDTLINEIPAVLITDFYGSIAILTALELFFLDKIEAIHFSTLVIVFVATIGLRLLAYYYNWRLPKP